VNGLRIYFALDRHAGGIKDYTEMLSFVLIKKGLEIVDNIQDADLVHYQLGGSSWKVGFNLLYRNKVTPTIVTVHDVLQRRIIIRNVYPYIFKRILFKSDLIILHSNHSREVFLSKYGINLDKKIKIIPHGCKIIDIDRKYARKILGLQENKTIFITGGFLIPHKGVHKIIEAFSKIDNQLYNLIIFGTGNKMYLNKLNNIIKKDNRIKYFGYLEQYQLDLLYSACDAVIVYRDNSLGETSGIVCRAIGAKRMIITSSVGSIKEILEDNAIYFHDNSIDEIKKCLENFIISSDNVQKLKEMADNYTWESIADDHLKCYKEICVEFNNLSR
jgi:glycosyltransferase involved in cell wall biosynthesis